MSEYTPRKITLIEFGMDQDSNFVTTSEDIPSVLRDERERILWKLPDNTSEENEQLGIRNVQGLFLEKFPEFNEFFPKGEDGSIAEDKREQAGRFIVQRIGSQAKFDSVLVSSAHVKIATPYFDGSYIVALQKSFSPWGVNLMRNSAEDSNDQGMLPEGKRAILKWPVDWHGRSILHLSGMTSEEIKSLIEDEARKFIQNGGVLNHDSLRNAGLRRLLFAMSQHYDGGIRQLRKNLGYRIVFEPIARNTTISWQFKENSEEENLELGIRNIQTLFLNSFPQFNELFHRVEDGLIESGKRRDARRFITERIGDQKSFCTIIRGVVTSLDYFDNSYLVALQRSFLPWGIDFYDVDIHDVTTIPRDSRGRIFWSLPGRVVEQERNTHLATGIMQALFLNKYPKFEQLFPRDEIGQIIEENKAEAARYILDRCGDRIKFIAVFGNTPLDKDSVSFFEGSFIQALRKIFAPWGINFRIRDFKAERVWKGKSREEIVRIVREIFFDQYPEFAGLFLVGEDENVTPEKAEEARAFILDSIVPKTKFEKLFGDVGNHACSNGSYRNVLNGLLLSFGIQSLLPETINRKRSLEVQKDNCDDRIKPQSFITDLTDELKQEILDAFLELIKADPGNPISLIDFAVDYIRETI